MDVTAADTAPGGAAALEQAMQQGETAAATAAAAAAPAAPAAAAAAWLQPLELGQQEPIEVGRPKKKKPNRRSKHGGQTGYERQHGERGESGRD